MLLSPKEIQENADTIIIDHHFELRFKKRNINIDEIKYYLKNKIPIINEITERKHKISYQLEKSRYLSMYILKTAKGLKILTVFIEKRIK